MYLCSCLYFTQVLRPGTWSYTVSYDGGVPVTGVKIAGQSGELDPRKLNMDVSIDRAQQHTAAPEAATATASVVPQALSACKQKTAWADLGRHQWCCLMHVLYTVTGCSKSPAFFSTALGK